MTEDPETQPPAGASGRAVRRRRWLRAGAWLLLLVVLAAAASVLRERWEAVGEAGGLPGLLPSAAAVVVYAAANALLAWNWRTIVSVAGTWLPYRTALWVWAVSQISRYTMTFAHVGGRAVVARRYGVPATAGVLSTLMELAWMFSVTSTIVLVTIPWWLPAASGARWLVWVAVLPVTGVLVAIARPRTVLRAIDAAVSAGPVHRLTRGRFAGVATRVGLTRGTMARFVGRYGANTVLRHTAFLTLFAAVGGDLRSSLLVAVGAYAVGSLAGTLAVFAPGGLGVREGLTALVLAPVIGGGPALLLVGTVRLLEVLAELATLGLARWLRGAEAGVAGTSHDRI